MFYNTINASGQILIEFEAKAESQKEHILALFERNPKTEFTPFDVCSLFEDKNWPITSIRRAISDLTDEGHLVKLNVLKDEKYGKPNHVWVLMKKQ